MCYDGLQILAGHKVQPIFLSSKNTGRTCCVARSAGVFWAGESSLCRSSGRKKERARKRETRVSLSRAPSFLGLLCRLGRNLLVYVRTVVTAIFDVMTKKD